MLVTGLVSATSLKRDFSAKQRDTLSQSGAAMPDGSFPIVNGKDLENAIHLVGRASDPVKAKAHIISRARALGLVSNLPDSWGVQKADLVDVFKFNPYHDKEGLFASKESDANLVNDYAWSPAELDPAASRDQSTVAGSYGYQTQFRNPTPLPATPQPYKTQNDVAVTQVDASVVNAVNAFVGKRLDDVPDQQLRQVNQLMATGKVVVTPEGVIAAHPSIAAHIKLPLMTL